MFDHNQSILIIIIILINIESYSSPFILFQFFPSPLPRSRPCVSLSPSVLARQADLSGSLGPIARSIDTVHLLLHQVDGGGFNGWFLVGEVRVGLCGFVVGEWLVNEWLVVGELSLNA